MSVFARLLDKERGGYFGIDPVGDYSVVQSYIPSTNILSTRFTSGHDAFEVLDYMPRHRTSDHQRHCPPDIVRYIRTISGAPQIRVQYEPRPGYAQHPAITESNEHYIKSFTGGRPYESIYLYTSMDPKLVAAGEPIALEAESFLLLSYNQKITEPTVRSVRLDFERTKVYWMSWVAESKPRKAYSEEIERSALVLKLLSYQKTGAVLAAATTSLPEAIGSERNWDYRFCWLRDASLTIRVFTEIGHYEVGRRFLQFILDIIPFKDEKIQILYGIGGEKNVHERTLRWLSGYENSYPARVGNAAFRQKQNDVFGFVVDMIYQKLLVARGDGG